MVNQAEDYYDLEVSYDYDGDDSLAAEIGEVIGYDPHSSGRSATMQDLSFDFQSANEAFDAELRVSRLLVAKNVRYSLEVVLRRGGK